MPTADARTARPAGDVHDGSLDRRWWFVLGAVLVVALAVRLAFVLVVQSHVVLNGDAFWYHFQARLVADGKGFLNPFAYFRSGMHHVPGADHPPAFIVLLAIGDHLGISSPQAQRAMMCVFGTASVAMIALAVRRMVNRRAALVVAVIAALYPNLWINDGMLMSETLYVFALSIALLFTYRVWQRARLGDVLVLSAALAVASLTRPESVLLYLVLLLPVVLARRRVPWRERLLQVGAAAAIPLVLFAPWVAYNLSRFDEPVYLSSGAGQTLLAGNCDSTYSGTFLGFWSFACIAPPQPQAPPGDDPSQADSFYRKRATDYIKHHLGDQPRVIAARVGRLWNVYRPGQGILFDWYIEGRGHRAQTEWALWGFYALVPFEIAGVVILRRRRIPLYPLLIQFALVTVVVAFTFGDTRYRVGADVAAIMLAAVTVDALLGLRWPARTADARPLRHDAHGDVEPGAGSSETTGPSPASPESTEVGADAGD